MYNFKFRCLFKLSVEKETAWCYRSSTTVVVFVSRLITPSCFLLSSCLLFSSFLLASLRIKCFFSRTMVDFFFLGCPFSCVCVLGAAAGIGVGVMASPVVPGRGNRRLDGSLRGCCCSKNINERLIVSLIDIILAFQSNMDSCSCMQN